MTFSKKNYGIVLTSIAVLLVVLIYIVVDPTSQPNNNKDSFLQDVKNTLDGYFENIPQRKDNQIFEQNIQTLHAEIDSKVRHSEITSNTKVHQIVIESNKIFSEMDSTKDYIDNVEKQWKLSGNNDDPASPDSVSYEITNNHVSEMLRDIVNSDQKSENRFKYAEIFLTNSYGANVAQTEKTSDYMQADETWWKEARENEIFIHEGYFDDSAGVYATEIAMAMMDDDENFIGVLKIVLDIDSIDRNKMFIDSWATTLFR